MKRILWVALAVAGAALLSGCPKKHNINDAPVAGTQVPDTAGANGEAASTSTTALGGDASSNARGLNGEGTGPLARKIIYFDFDKSEIKPEYADVVSTAAHTLTANPKLKMKLEGNTDNRGTREYNIALSARRATATREFLMAQGVQANRISSIAYGKERPVALCDAEQCWSQTRRAVTVITGGAQTS